MTDAVGPYRLESVLGEGPWGRVHLGRTPAGGAVAVKVVRPEPAADPGFRQRFERDVAAVRAVHGLYTVPIVGADTSADPPWLAMAYVPSPSLHRAVAEHGPMRPEAAVPFVAGLAEALQSLHAAGVVHRNLKPSNVFLTPEGPRLTDYGLAQVGDLTPPGDVYALGVVAYFAVTGAHALEPDVSGLPEPLRGIIAGCVARDPSRRPTPAEIIQRCHAPVSAPPRHTRRNVLLAAGLVGVVGVGVAIPVLWPDGEDDTESRPPETSPSTTPPGGGEFQLAAELEGHTSSVLAVAFSPDGKLLATGGMDRTVRLWDLERRLQRAVLTGHTNMVSDVAFSPDGRTLASCASFDLSTGKDDGTIVLWDVVGRRQRAALTGHTSSVYGVAFSPDGRLLASAAADGTVRVWDVAGGTEAAVLTGHDNEVSNVAFSPDGRLVASASSVDGVGIWDVAAGRLVADLAGHTNEVQAVAFSPDGGLLASAARDGTVRLWDVAGQRQRATFTYDQALKAVTFSPDGELVATCGRFDHKVPLWEVAGGSLRATLDGDEPIGGVNDVAFAADGTALAWVDNFGTVKLWKRA